MRSASFPGLLRAAVGRPGWKGIKPSHVALSLVALLVLVWWGGAWNRAVKKWKLKNSPVAWYDPYDFVSLDFLHNYQASRFWLSGHDPYREDFKDPIGRKLCYPPVVLACFAWCKLLPVQKAIAVWTLSLGCLAGLGAVAAWQTRRRLGLAPVPLLVTVAAVVTSAPVAFAMERGNYDLLVVPLILLMAWGLRRSGWRADGVIAAALGLAICLKVYPGLLGFALLALGRWRAAGLTAVAVAALLGFQAHNLPVFVQNLRALSDSMQVHGLNVLPATHSLTFTWKPLWFGSQLGVLTVIPGAVAAAAVVGGLLLWASWHVRRSADPGPLLVPYLLWTAAAATFVPRVSNDYNLVFLPMAALAVWDRRDSVPAHVALGFFCLVMQPVSFGLSTSVLFGFKVAGLVATAACLVSRARERAAPAPAAAVVIAAHLQASPTTECCHVE